MRGVKIAVGVVVLGLVLAGCSSTSGTQKANSATSPTTSPTPQPFTISGTLTLNGQNWLTENGKDGEPCFGDGGYADLTVGAQVVAVDGSGTTIGLGSISASSADFTATPRVCTFQFAVTNVPAGKGFYSVKIGQHSAPQYSEADAKRGLALTLS